MSILIIIKRGLKTSAEVLPQVAIAQINERIGAAGVVNHECKQVVAGYGQQMLELLKAQV